MQVLQGVLAVYSFSICNISMLSSKYLDNSEVCVVVCTVNFLRLCLDFGVQLKSHLLAVEGVSSFPANLIQLIIHMLPVYSIDFRS